MKKIIALILALSMLTVAGTACKDKKDTDDGASSAVNVGPNNNPDEEWMNNIDESNISIEDFDIPLQVGKNLDSNEIMKMMFPEAAELAGVNTTTAATTTKVTTKAAAKTVAQTVTDSSGKAVTDAAGSAVTTMVTTTAATVDAASHVPVMEELQSLWINVSRSRDYVFEGKMITITFRVKDDAPVNAISPIQILRPDFCNYGSNTSNGHPEQLYPAIIDGSVTVGSTPKSGGSSQRDFAVYVDNVAAQPGDEVVVNINVANNPGFVAFQLYFSYDSALLEYISSSEGSDFQNAMK